jgi:hypothetical protein
VALPVVTLEVDFAAGPLAVPTAWTDLSSRVRRLSVRAGRQQEIGRTEVGGGVVVLDNQDRALDPTNSAGPFFPNVLPMRHIRIRATNAGVTYDLARGYVRSFPQSWRERVAAEVEVEFEDAFSMLARYELANMAARPAELSGARINAVLDAFGWPAAASAPAGTWLLESVGSGELGTNTRLGQPGRTIDPGQSVIRAEAPAGNLLAYLLLVAEDTERGLFYVRPNGELTFVDRPTNIGSPAAVFGDDLAGGELRMRDLRLSYDDEKLWSVVRVSIEGSAVVHEAVDPAAVTSYGPRVLSLSGVIFDSELDAESLAGYLLNRYSTPAIRPERLSVLPRPADVGEWAQILGRALSDRVLVERRPPGGGAPISLDARIVGIEHAVTPGSWETSWSLVPTEPASWILAQAEYGELGQTTTLGF